MRSLAPLRRGRFDPCQHHVGSRIVWRTQRTVAGPALARIAQVDHRTVQCHAWGPGAELVVEALPALLGALDDPESFDAAGHRLVQKLHGAHPWLRMPRTGSVFDALFGAVLEQRVTVREALDARNALLRSHADAPPASPAAMPSRMRIMPDPARWLTVPSWAWKHAGVDVHRRDAILRAAAVASRIDETATMPREAGIRRLRAIPGIGIWTVAETRQRSHGDADCVSFGDVHLARFVGHALLGHAVDDEGMAELLEPFRGHRHRVVRLLQLGAALGAVAVPPRVPSPRPRRHLRF